MKFGFFNRKNWPSEKFNVIHENVQELDVKFENFNYIGDRILILRKLFLSN